MGKSIQEIKYGRRKDDLKPEADIDQENSLEGISDEEKDEIMKAIDELVKDNKIAINDNLFEIKPKKSGILIPFVVLLSAILIIAVSYKLLSDFFKKNEIGLLLNDSIQDSTEGSLLEKTKEDLDRKDAEIQKIRESIDALNRESDYLKSNMEIEIDKHREQLKKEMELKLSAERERLKNEGKSQAEIIKELNKLKVDEESKYKQNLDSFKLEKDNEIRVKEEALSTAIGTLEKINLEKTELEEKYKSKNEELQRQLQNKTAETEQKLKALASAQEADKIARERQLFTANQEKKFLNTILNKYSIIVDSTSAGEYSEALHKLENLKAYLFDSRFDSLPSIRTKRDIESEAIDSFKKLIYRSKKGSENNSDISEAELRTSRNELERIKTNLTEKETIIKKLNLNMIKKQKAIEELNRKIRLSRSAAEKEKGDDTINDALSLIQYLSEPVSENRNKKIMEKLSKNPELRILYNSIKEMGNKNNSYNESYSTDASPLDSLPGYKFLGTISAISNGNFTIEQDVSITVKRGVSIRIRRIANNGKEMNIANGIITKVITGKIIAKIGKIYAGNQPEEGDMVFIVPTQ